MKATVASARQATYYALFGADVVLAHRLRAGWRILDVGCSDGRGSSRLSGADGVDIHRPSLVTAALRGHRGPVVQADVRCLPYRSGAFDAVVALDVIEHFEKDDALVVLREMERVSRRLVLLMTPKGFLEQPGTGDQPWQEHRCGFEPAELRELGFQTIGLGGLDSLRGDYGSFRWGVPGQLLAAATLPYVRRRPDRAFHVMGVKRVGPR